MTLKQIKKTLKEWHNESHRNDLDLLNITYYLIKNYHYSKSIKNIDESDLMIIYDNLLINNEIIDSDNLNDYGEKYISSLMINNQTMKKIKNGSHFLLLNYYNDKNNLRHCKLLFKYGHDELLND